MAQGRWTRTSRLSIKISLSGRLKPHLRKQGAVAVLEECTQVRNQAALKRHATLALNLLRVPAGEVS